MISSGRKVGWTHALLSVSVSNNNVQHRVNSWFDIPTASTRQSKFAQQQQHYMLFGACVHTCVHVYIHAEV